MKINLLIVTFSLRSTAKNYDQFFVALRGNALQWWHFIEQTCVVATHHEPNQFAQFLIPHIDAMDALLVAKIQPFDFQGWLPIAAWDWLNSVSSAGIPKLPTLKG